MGANSIYGSTVIENANLLSTRVDIKQRLQLAIAKARLGKTSLALFFIDLDRFTTVASTLGPQTAQALVDTVMQRLSYAIDNQHKLLHLGADEFVLLLETDNNSTQLRQLANRLLNTIRKPIYIDEQQLITTASIGASVYPSKAEDDQTLLHQSITAMKSVKEIGGDGLKFFTRHKTQTSSLRKLNLEVELRHAISRKDLEVHYQPKMDLRTGRVSALEALVRWRHDTLGWINPSEFIPIAENAGLISNIGEMVLETAMKHGRKWIDDGIPHIKVAVNLSAKQLLRHDMTVVIKRLLKRTGFPASQLVIELTESLLLDTLNKTKASLETLREMGIELAIDDFGTGYSTFKLLKELPVDILKIDQMFIQDITNNKVDSAITRAIIDVAHALDMRVIAEGVEDEAHVNMLQELGCDSIQGFYLSQPLPRNEVSKLLRVGVPNKFEPALNTNQEHASLV